MADSDLDDIRAKRMAELQKQYGGNPTGSEGGGEKNHEDQRQKQEEMRNAMLSSLLTQEARARLNTIAVAKPDKARMVEDILMQNARRGAFGGKVSEEQLINILEQVNKATEKTTKVNLINMDGVGYGSEHSIIDANKRLMMLRTRNLTLNRYLSVEENLQYMPHPENNSKTLLKQEATITVKNVPLTNYMEALIEKTINSNANKGRQAIEWVIRRMHNDLPRTIINWNESNVLLRNIVIMVDWTNSRQQRQLSVTQYNPIIDGYSHKTTGSIAGSNRSRRPSWSDAKKDFIEDDEAFSDAHTQLLKNLDLYYRKVKRQLLAFQSLPTGLFPNHLEPKKKVAHVVENVFCAISVWSLRQCYIKIDNDQGRAHELGQAAVKCMRGILNCWMKQAVKLEIFKGEQSPKDALHSKFNVYDGSEVSGADEVGQLQICAISLYLLTIAQMITSGLQIIYSIDEVNFIQQLVFYIERAYRTPDYGIWGRGSKYNNNTCELHASSIGMAKAALETMNGFNLYGERGASWSVVYVDIDAHNRNRTTFDTLLPRESASKNTDAALLFTVSWPAFSIHDTNLVQTTIKKCIRKLRGSYGFKRFLRDGQYTTIEPKDKRFYEASEIKKFDKNECEWPMFFALMVIDGLFKNNQPQIDEYLGLLNPLLRRTTE
ncbi:unnamed protein product, partial [Didymodactylos carnosus]